VALPECMRHALASAGRPVGVAVRCPAYVDTGIADANRHRPTELADANPDNASIMERTRDAMKAGRLSAADVARFTMDAVRDQRFYILPHRRAADGFEQRVKDFLDGSEPYNPLLATRW